MPRTMNRVSHLEFAQLSDTGKLMASDPEIFTKKEIKKRFEVALGRKIAMSTVLDLCTHSSLQYKGGWGKKHRGTTIKSHCPHCKKPITLSAV